MTVERWVRLTHPSGYELRLRADLDVEQRTPFRELVFPDQPTRIVITRESARSRGWTIAEEPA